MIDALARRRDPAGPGAAYRFSLPQDPWGKEPQHGDSDGPHVRAVVEHARVVLMKHQGHLDCNRIKCKTVRYYVSIMTSSRIPQAPAHDPPEVSK